MERAVLDIEWCAVRVLSTEPGERMDDEEDDDDWVMLTMMIG